MTVTPPLSRLGRLLRRLPWKAVRAAPVGCGALFGVNVLYRTLDDLVAAFRKGVRRATVKREQMGFMFDHDDLLQEIAEKAKAKAASLFPRVHLDRSCATLGELDSK